MAPIIESVGNTSFGFLSLLASGSFESIASATGTGSSGTISFTSIPSTYKHLQIRYIAKSTDTGAAATYIPTMIFNNSTTAATYAAHYLRGNGSTVVAGENSGAANISFNYASIPNSATAYANMHGVGILDIIDYTSTSKQKTLRGIAAVDINSTSNASMMLFSGLWLPSTITAITRIDITVPTGNWTTTSSFSLYGIK